MSISRFQYSKLIFTISLLLMARSAWAAGTAAGTIISNVVEVSYQVSDSSDVRYVETATDVFTVSELIRTNVTALEPQGVGTATPAVNAVLSYQLSNTGNGDELFLLTYQAGLPGQFLPSVTGIWVESNNTAGWQADDTLYLASSGGVKLSPDESKVIYVVSDIPSGVEDEAQSDVVLISTAATEKASIKSAGASLEIAGDNGIEAVIAQENASHQDTSHYTVSTVRLDVEKKIISIEDPYGGRLSMPGSEVTYQIKIAASGFGIVSDFIVEDPVPESMTYKNNSLKMNGNDVSDDSDSDNGHFDYLHETAYFFAEKISAPSVNEYTLTYVIE